MWSLTLHVLVTSLCCHDIVQATVARLLFLWVFLFCSNGCDEYWKTLCLVSWLWKISVDGQIRHG